MVKKLVGSVGLASSGVPDDLLTTKGDTHGFSSTNARIPIGDDDDVLTADSGEALGLKWSPSSASGTLVKVTKDYTDIVVGTTSMPIYTLPVHQALTNVYTDITTAFDISTAVVIGDSADENGFQETANWTSTGLSSATRGIYVSQFKGMRSVSGTTAISAYDFSTGGSSTFSQTTASENYTMKHDGRIEIAQQMNAGQILVDEDIVRVSFYLKNYLTGQSGTIRAFIRQADGTEVQESTDTLDASTLTGSTLPYSFGFPATTLLEDYMICVSAVSMTGGQIMVATDSAGDLTDGTLYQKATPSAGFTTISNNAMTFTASYGSLVSDTQGVVDFYLQIAKE